MTHFSEFTFFYMMSRNRSICGAFCQSFYRNGEGEIFWEDTREKVCDKVNQTAEEKIIPQDCKTTTFIYSSVYENASYLSILKALSLVEKERLLLGNWKIRSSAGLGGDKNNSRK